MTSRALTASETAARLRGSLRDYIEAAYHVGDRRLVEQRRQILDDPGVIHQEPYLESTPRYTTGRPFAELDIPEPARRVIEAVTSEAVGPDGDRLRRRLYDPPFTHQAQALVAAIRDGRSLVVTTGTGSGKTESFLMPILGRLARQAADGTPFRDPAVRAVLLYPMNALVNDQLGRLRLLLGDPRVRELFQSWAGRPARFARYTSRTLYPGVRTRKKDQDRLTPLKSFYVDTLRAARNPDAQDHDAKRVLYDELRARGKWPAKPDLDAWWGADGAHWEVNGEPARCVTLPDDAELLTRHEVLAAPPDVLVTNYSMLEYMMMRPVERPVFDRTRQWLADHPDERLLLVVDEAHLYRGASGAEVALLLRRLQERLDIDASRLQVILTSASFGSPENARRFAADLTGLDADRFDVVEGTLADRPDPGPGSSGDARLLAALDLDAFYEGDDDARRAAVQPLLDARGTPTGGLLEEALHAALESYPPLSLLVNRSMREALAVRELGPLVFPDAPETAERAVTALIALGSAARPDHDEPGLLPCRVHMFFRGLPGLWACLDPDCSALADELHGGPTGALYAQPRHTCDCGARVYELYTCRSCGTAHARAYVSDPERPAYLWTEPGEPFRLGDGRVEAREPLDLLLEDPDPDADTERVEVDLVTGRVNVRDGRNRRVYLPIERAPRPLADGARPPIEPGQFERCAVCDATASFGRSPVQDHQTKGDQPFQALVTEQVEVQPPSTREATAFAPLRGRKTLIFSDSRQLAARMAPVVQTLSTRDALRPLLVVGYDLLQRHDVTRPFVSLDHLYTAVLLAAAHLGVRLRPPQTARESFHSPEIEAAVANGVLDDPTGLALLLAEARRPPQALARDLRDALAHRYYGLRPLGLATLRERDQHTPRVTALPDLPGLAESDRAKLAVARLWLQNWLPDSLHLSILDAAAVDLSTASGMFKPFGKWLGDHKAAFAEHWQGPLLDLFAQQKAPRKFWLRGTHLTLDTAGPWAYCDRCRTTQRPVPGSARCIQCAADGTVRVIDPDEDPVFVARKGYYRATTVSARRDGDPPAALLAAEHTAQLNAVREGEVYSEAERHELLFQDVDLGPDDEGRRRYALDVLSCTTTMEVGIDIGSLSGVALRNLPPARSNYQQRAGRAGRRGNAVASVVAFGSADSHDEHYFSQPAEMIRGAVADPALTLSNRDITRRHLTAYLLQRYFHEAFPDVSPDDPANHSLFAALGPVAQFLSDDPDALTLAGFAAWLAEREDTLRADVGRWLPDDALANADRQALLDGVVGNTVAILQDALDVTPAEIVERGTSEDDGAGEGAPPEDAAPEDAPPQSEDDDGTDTDDAEHGGRRAAQTYLLDRLLYEGVLPKYAFPTDVAGFHVFDRNRSTPFRPAFEYVPQQGLAAALSQYAPGKQLYIGNRRWTSGALYDAHPGSLFAATSTHASYVECERCGYAETQDSPEDHDPDCPACGDPFPRPKRWIRPPGFAHPVYLDPDTTPDAPFAQSYATRAKLAAPVRGGDVPEAAVNDRVSTWAVRDHLLVTNRGPEQMGYHLCVKCGRIERSAQAHTDLAAPHEKPYPHRDRECPGFLWRSVVLGTTFVSDVLLLGFRLDPPAVALPPGSLGTEVALRTVSEALALAACDVLQLEPGEIEAEFRPAVGTSDPEEGAEVEVYLYDTLPGGAGFSHRAGERIDEILRQALHRLDHCPGQCDGSCYRCLRRFTNRFEHDRLDRHVGADLLRFLLDGHLPTLSAQRQDRATRALAEDLRRALGPRATVEQDATREIPGVGPVQVPLVVATDRVTVLVAVSSPVAPDVPPTPELRRAMDASLDGAVRLLDETLVRKNLPHATELVRSWVGSRS